MEIVQLVDEANRPTGCAPRPEMRAGRLRHRAAYVFVFNSRGKLYVQRRTLTKDIYPGRLDLAAGGVVLAGESYEECAARELAEELGIRGVPLTAHFDFYYEDAAGRVWGRVFSCAYEGPLALQKAEVESVTLIRSEEALAGPAGAYTPDSLGALRRFVDEAGGHPAIG